jgi:hypothetical protein
MADAGGGECQQECLVTWRRAAGAVQPPARRGAMARGKLGLGALARLERERGVISRLAQRPTACCSAGSGSAEGGGNAARS